MQEGGSKKSRQEDSGHFIWHGDKPYGPDSPAEPDEAASEDSGSGGMPEAYETEFPEPDEKQKHKKLLVGVGSAILFAAVLCAVAFFGGKLGLFGNANLSIALPKNSSAPISANQLSFASVYLKTQPWDKKTHSSLKSLEKMKNLRYALNFFEKYGADEIASMPSRASNIDDAAANYDTLVGSLISIDAKVSQKNAVTESIMPGSNAASTLLSLAPDRENGSIASILVIGSPLDQVKAGDTLSFVCLPVYSYSPSDKASGGIFLVTIPELVQSVG